MKKRGSWLCLALLAFAGIAAAQRIPTPTTDDVAFTMPSGWALRPIDAGPELISHYVYNRGGIPLAEFFFSCQILNEPKPLDQVVREGIDKGKADLPFYQDRGSQRIQVAGVETIVHDFSYVVASSVTFVGRAYVMIVNAKAYTFLFNSVGQSIGALQGLMGQVMNSVRIAAPPPKPEPKPEIKATPVPGTPPAKTPGRRWWRPPSPVEKEPPANKPAVDAGTIHVDPAGRFKIVFPQGTEIFRQDGSLTSYKNRARKAYFQVWSMKSVNEAGGMEAYATRDMTRDGRPFSWATRGMKEAYMHRYKGKDSADRDVVVLTALYGDANLLLYIEIQAKAYEASAGWIEDLVKGVEIR